MLKHSSAKWSRDLAALESMPARTVGGMFGDARLNTVLRGLDPTERGALFAYAEGEGTWAEAAAAVGAADPEAFGERVRRKARRLASEQHRRADQCRLGAPPS